MRLLTAGCGGVGESANNVYFNVMLLKALF